MLPRALIDQLSAEFTFLISLGVLSILLIAFIDLNISVLQILAGGALVGALNVSDLLTRLRLNHELKKEE